MTRKGGRYEDNVEVVEVVDANDDGRKRLPLPHLRENKQLRVV